MTAPLNLAFVPVDFEKHSLIERLRNSGYRTKAPSFFSWLGVTQYLTRDAVFDTLRTVASMTPGTEIIFEYSPPDDLLDEESRRVREVAIKVTGARGEPWLSFIEPAELIERLRKLGFAEVWDLGPMEANPRYFANRADELRLRSAHFMGARVRALPLGARG